MHIRLGARTETRHRHVIGVIFLLLIRPLIVFLRCYKDFVAYRYVLWVFLSYVSYATMTLKLVLKKSDRNHPSR